jgi:hypothetical protein
MGHFDPLKPISAQEPHGKRAIKFPGFTSPRHDGVSYFNKSLERAIDFRVEKEGQLG